VVLCGLIRQLEEGRPAMRACQPCGDGYVERDGVKTHHEVFGDGEPTVLLLPTWSIIHLLAANHPERVEAAVFIGPSYPGVGRSRR
jgi:hypothetical protein